MKINAFQQESLLASDFSSKSTYSITGWSKLLNGQLTSSILLNKNPPKKKSPSKKKKQMIKQNHKKSQWNSPTNSIKRAKSGTKECEKEIDRVAGLNLDLEMASLQRLDRELHLGEEEWGTLARGEEKRRGLFSRSELQEMMRTREVRETRPVWS